MIPLLMLALAQAPVVSLFDEGLVVGRVCEDANQDGACSDDEPGIFNARVALETGLTSISDEQGRFHFAAVSARAPEAAGGGRLLPGRHRLGLDARWLSIGLAAPPAVTIEVPMGAVVVQDVAVRRVESASAAPSLAPQPPRVSRAQQRTRWRARLLAPPGAELRVKGVATAGDCEVDLDDGPNLVPFTSVREGRIDLWLLPIDVVRRKTSVLVAPRAIRSAGHVTVDSAGTLHRSLTPEARVLAEGSTLTFSVGSALWSESVSRPLPNGVFALGLLDLQASFDPIRSSFQVAGRGAGMARARLGSFELSAEVDLRDADVNAVIDGKAASLLQARRVDVFERQLDLDRTLTPPGIDGSATLASNASEARLRAELAQDDWGRLGVGTTRFRLTDGEVGRAHRAIQGAYVDVHTPAGATWQVGVRGSVGGTQTDVLSGLGRRPAHERFESTGGSLFFLAHSPIVQGSELVRIEWRDPVTQLAVRDFPLRRLEDYSVDTASGRLLLSRPLSFLAEQTLAGDPLSLGVTMVLVVDYEFVDTEVASGFTAGGEVHARTGPVKVSAAGLHDGSFDLLRGRAEATLGPVWLSAEVARSSGAQQGLAWSRDGGLSFLSRGAREASSGWAGLLRARTVGLFGRGSWDASARFREAGFEDAAGVGRVRQLSLRGEQPLGPFVVSAIADVREGPDPRDPFSNALLAGHLLAGAFGYERDRWGVRLEARETLLALDDAEARGGFSLGLHGRWRATPWLQLRAGYRHQLIAHGSGLDDTFATVGFDLAPWKWLTVGVRGGWGPATGVLAWGTLAATRGDETWYGAHSLDADSPGAGDRRLVSGVRKDLAANTSVFVEDVSTTDVNGLRLGRAVGLSQRLEALTVSLRYERGARTFDGLTPDVLRDAGGATLAWETKRVRAFARGEVRIEQGGVAQWLATGGGELALTGTMTASARVQFSHSSRNSLLQSRVLDALVGFSWRPAFGALIVRYAFHREWMVTEQWRHVVSLLPTVRISDRFQLSAGAHVGVLDSGLALAASLRPAVRIIAGLEVALEGAARSVAPDGGALFAARAEVGYRFDHRFYLGAGYALFGFSGTGLEAGATGSNNRIFLRTEVAY